MAGKRIINLIDRLSNIKEDGSLPLDKPRRITKNGKVINPKVKRIKTPGYRRNAIDSSHDRKEKLGKIYVGTFLNKEINDTIVDIVNETYTKTKVKITKESVINLILSSYLEKTDGLKNFPFLKVVDEYNKDRKEMTTIIQNRENKKND